MSWWLVPKRRPDTTEGRVAEARRRYAAEITAGLAHGRVEEAFAATARERYLTPPPWTIFAPGGLFTKDTSDPLDLYQDVLVVLDRERGINNGQPSLHAAWMAALDPEPGEVVVQIGAGSGYYTAVLAALVAPGGAVHAFEIEAHLAEIAARNLAALPSVTVHAATGVGAALPSADIIYVSASVSAPDAAWLRALKRYGRMVFPWQPTRGGGVALQVTHTERGFRARPTMEVSFIACVGATTTPKLPGRTGLDEVTATRSLWLMEERPPDDTATAIFADVWFSSREV
jgi:protein-L-isoaspartate(D-aspartate) O-methyltransferase